MEVNMLKHFLPVLFLFVLCGCLPSLNPLSKKNDCVVENLPGVWNDRDGGEYEISLKDEKYRIAARTKNQDGTENIIYYDMIISKIDGSLYASVILNKETFEKYPQRIKDTVLLCTIPFYWIFKMETEGDTVRLLVYDDGNKNIPPLKNVTVGDARVFSSDETELRDWIVRYNKSSFKTADSFCYTKKRRP